jgi:predicted phosphoribosyltransferase
MFLDREDAGQQLGVRLKGFPLLDPLVLGIPRGGVVTGAAIARELGADLDVVLARKLRSPVQPELAFGAIGEDGQVYLNHYVEEATGVSDEYLQAERQRQLAEIRRRQKMFRAVRPAAPLSGRCVILTDDGIATGSTMFAAIEVVKAHQPHELIVAIPVAPADRLESIRARCNRLICLQAPIAFWAVGQFYESFEPVEDDEVVAILREFAPAQQVAS